MEDANTPVESKNKTTMWVVLLTVIVAVLVGATFWAMYGKDESGTDVAEDTSDRTASPIEVTGLKPNDFVKSPLRVTGRARGWYFEGSFPVSVVDTNGRTLGIGPVQAQTDWMTADWVAFDGTIPFSDPTVEAGFVVFQKDNPSGLPEHDEEYRVPVRFATPNTEFNFDLDVK